MTDEVKEAIESLQKKNLQLLEAQEKNSAAVVEDIENYIEQISKIGRFVNDVELRQQLRALANYWGTAVYNQTGSLPNTTLLPVDINKESAISSFDKIQFQREQSQNPTDYHYDIYLSYPCGSILKEWIDRIFLRFLKEYSELLYRPLRIYVGEENLLSTSQISENAQNALVYSRCLIAVCSPSYFKNQQTIYEISVMINRERRLGYRTHENQDAIVIPVMAMGSKHFPEIIQKVENQFDCSDFTRINLEFVDRYVKFQDIMIKWIDNVLIRTISKSPSWNKSFFEDLSPDNSIINSLQISLNYNFTLPTWG